MIHIYRATRYSDHDNFIFQATEDTIKEFRFRFPVKVQEAKRGFEGGYFTFLRGSYRETFFDFIKAYLRTNYSPPELRLSAFRTVVPLSSLWPTSMWQQKVTDAIRGVFVEKGYRVNQDEFLESVEVTPNKPSFSVQNVQIYYGVSFRVEVPDDRYPILWCLPQFKVFMDGKPANLEGIARVHGEGSLVTQEVRHFTTRNANEQFDILKRFIRQILPLTSCEGISFGPEPIDPQQIGFSTWFWLHDSEACFEVSNGLRTTLAQALLTEGSGFYTQPDDIQVIVLLPIPDSSPAIPLVDWEQVVITVNTFLAQTLPDVETPVSVMDYPLQGDLGAVIQEVETAVNSFPGLRVLCLMVTPGPKDRFSQSSQVREAEAQSFQLNKKLRSMFKGGYTATVDWNKLQSAQDMPYVIHNALVGSLYRLNAQPWLLSNLPFRAEHPEAVYFLGLVGDAVACKIAGTLFDYQGSLVAFGAICPDTVEDSTDAINSLIQSLLREGVHRSKPKPAHLIVHVPPELATYVEEIQSVLQTLSVTSDVVAIEQRSKARFWQPYNKQGTPSHGIAIGSETQEVAYLMNTLSLAENTNRGYIFPNPGVVAVRRLAGTTLVKSLAAHAYWLSVAHINALHRTIDIPITISYAQALYDHISKSQKSMRVTKNYKKTLYWL